MVQVPMALLCPLSGLESRLVEEDPLQAPWPHTGTRCAEPPLGTQPTRCAPMAGSFSSFSGLGFRPEPLGCASLSALRRELGAAAGDSGWEEACFRSPRSRSKLSYKRGRGQFCDRAMKRRTNIVTKNRNRRGAALTILDIPACALCPARARARASFDVRLVSHVSRQMMIV